MDSGVGDVADAGHRGTGRHRTGGRRSGGPGGGFCGEVQDQIADDGGTPGRTDGSVSDGPGSGGSDGADRPDRGFLQGNAVRLHRAQSHVLAAGQGGDPRHRIPRFDHFTP
ncbi:hypothetical protein [Streptomyces sp. B21-083]|uniref:hypothetical protein n=1 Tax=Streptomyces sp. B21-083 TaxID=3039410 RepID=UPI002FF0993F